MTWLAGIRQAARSLLRQRVGAAAALLTLALGLGANTAIFSVADHVLLRPVPIADARRLLVIGEASPQRTAGVSGPAYQQLAGHATLFHDLAAYQSAQLALIEPDAPELVWGYEVTPNFFAWLRAQPLRGRTFTAADARPDGPRLVVLSHAFWRFRFGADPAIVGKAIPLSNETFAPPGRARRTSVVIGVMPEGFAFPQDRSGQRRDFWTTVDLDRASFTRPWDRQLRNWTVLARPREGIEPSAIEAALDRLAAENAASHPQAAAGWRFDVQPLVGLFSSTDFRLTLASLVAAVTIVLIIACVNVTNLLLTRAEYRRREFAIRSALGAGRARLVGQVLSESSLLALASGAAGWVVATWGVAALASRLPPALPQVRPVALDLRALAFMLALSLVVGTLVGLIPAWQASRRRGTVLLRAGRPASRDRRRTTSALVASQVALSMLLLSAAGLLLRSVSNYLAVEPGYDVRRLSQFMVTHFNITFAERTAKLAALGEAFHSIPGIEAVATWTHGSTGRILAGAVEAEVDHVVIGASADDFFETFQIPLRRGRTFDRGDLAPEARTVIVNETMAQRLWPGAVAIGQTFGDASGARRFEVAGVAGDVVEHPERPVRPRFYEPYERYERPTMHTLFAVRAAAGAPDVAPAIRSVLWRLEPLTIPPEMMSLERAFDALVAPRRTLLQLLGCFAILALLLTAVGLYGVINQAVARRTPEIGVRMALGADARAVLRLVLGQAARVVAAGLLLGILAAPVLGRALESVLFGVRSTDAITLAGVALTIAATATVACLLPARRATRIDPSISLRAD